MAFALRVNLLAVGVILCTRIKPIAGAACYYDFIRNKTGCNGLSYPARLGIAGSITVVGTAILVGISFLVRKRLYGNQNTPPPVSAGYFGPPQQAPYAPYAQPPFYPGQAPPPVGPYQANYNQPVYQPPPGPPPVLQDHPNPTK